MAHQIPSFYRYVESITITNAGSGYNSANPPAITISGGGGTGATATCTVVSGEIATVTVTNIGNGYTSTPTVTVAGSGGAILTAVLNFAHGPKSEHIKVNANNVKYTLPEFVQNDYTTFVTFLEKYYDWMDSENNPINLLLNKSYYDIDEATDNELEKWRLLLARKWPKTIPVDKKFFYKHIKDIYESKGTKASTESFFRLFYGEDVDVIYPSKYVLRASDGRWQQSQAIKVTSANDYEVLNLQGKLIDLCYYSTTGTLTRLYKIEAEVVDVIKIAYTAPQQYEVYLKFESARTSIPGPGADGRATPVWEGPIDTVDTIGAADASRAAGTYTITTADWTSDGDGSAAEFTVVVDGAGAATITIDTDGEGFVIDETITIADADLGGGGGADLTFDVATLVEGELKLNDVTVTDAGQDYLAAPIVSIIDPSGGTGAEIRAEVANSVITDFDIDNKGSGYYSSTTTLSLNTDSRRTFIVLRDELPSSSNVKAYLGRTLTSISAGTYSGADAGFSAGQVFSINESGDDAIGYALDYFAEDYVIIGGTNDSYGKIITVSSSNAPSTWRIITPGYGFNKGSVDLVLTSATGETSTVTLTTGYLFTYTGQYVDDRGKLSDVNRLQDNRKYQSYSYIVKSSTPQSDWNDIIKGTIHPAGWEVFGDLTITNEVVFSDITVTAPGYHIRFFEEDIFAGEGGDTSDAIAIEYFMVKEDTATTSELVAKLVERPLADSATIDDSGSQDYFAEDYMVDADSYLGEGGFVIHFGKNTEDATTTSEEIGPFTVNKALTDTTISDDAGEQNYFANDAGNYLDNDFYVRDGGLQISYQKYLQDVVSVTESFAYLYDWGVNPSDTVTATELFGYVMEKIIDFSDTVTASETFVPVVTWTASFTDTATVAETVEIGTSLPFTEAQSVSDTPVLNIQPNPSDSVSVTEVINNFNISQVLADIATPDDKASIEDENEVLIGKRLNDSASATESHAISYITSFSDSVSATESFNAQIFIPVSLADSATATESSTLTVGKNPSDTATTTDNGTSWTLTRAIADTATTDDRASIADENQVSVGKTLADSVTTSDSVITEVSIEQVLADSATATQQLIISYDLNNAETLTSTDVPVINTSNANTDSAGAAEADAKDFGKNITDSGALATESATANVQNYSDPTYFAEDYVGTNYTL